MSAAPGVASRRVAIDALVRIDRDDAYANLALGPILERSGLDERDRGLVTELVYGSLRMRRACDWLVDRFVSRAPDPTVRAALRVGAYQLVFLGSPPHAAVASTVGAVDGRARGFVNAVLRRVATAGVPEADDWPREAVRLSYPDWIVEWAHAELGAEAVPALEAMNRAAPVTRRADGYIQDQASQWVAAAVGAQPGDLVVDPCAAPGGKATALAAAGATVVAGDVHASRIATLRVNAERLADGRGTVLAHVADGRWLPLASGRVDRVLVDAPCSGLGVLRRRADARWRIGPEDVGALAELQRSLLGEAIRVLRPGGTLVYSVCTLTEPETIDIDAWLADEHPELRAQPAPEGPWRPRGRGAWLLPHWADTDGMYLLVLERPR